MSRTDMRAKIMTLQEFWGHVPIGSDQFCWNWIGSQGHDRYVRITLNGVRKYAHHIVYEEVYGAIPSNQVVMHTCDNTICCNPIHLKLGTQKENCRDRVNKKRWVREQHPRAKLTWDKVKEIRVLSRSGMSNRELAIRYNVTAVNIKCIITNKIWKC